MNLNFEDDVPNINWDLDEEPLLDEALKSLSIFSAMPYRDPTAPKYNTFRNVNLEKLTEVNQSIPVKYYDQLMFILNEIESRVNPLPYITDDVNILYNHDSNPYLELDVYTIKPSTSSIYAKSLEEVINIFTIENHWLLEYYRRPDVDFRFIRFHPPYSSGDVTGE